MCGIISFSLSSYLQAQVLVTNYSNKDDVYAIKIKLDTIWIGTSGGIIVRHITDSNTDSPIATYTIKDGLGSNFITCIAVDNKNRKWFGTIDNGVTSFIGTQWKTYNFITSGIENNILCLEADNKGGVWAGTYNGAYYFNGTNWTTYNTASTIIGQVRSISIEGNNTWFGTNNGFYLFDGTSWSHFTMLSTGNLPSNEITCIQANGDSIFIGTKVGISRYIHKTNTWNNYPAITYFSNNDILDIDTNVIGVVNVGTSNGLYTFYDPSWIQSGLTFNPNRLAEIEYDRYGFLWVGFHEFGRGIEKEFGSTPIQYPDPNPTVSGNNISSIVSDVSTIYIGTHGHGLSQYNGTWNTYNNANTLGQLNDNINDMTVDNGGVLWLATNNRVSTFDGTNWVTLDSANNGLISNKVNAVSIDQNNTKWFGTVGGVSKYDDVTWTDITTADGLYEDAVIAITVDLFNNVWFLHPNGLSMYNGVTFTTYAKTNLGISAASILYDLAADKNAGIWIGTNEGAVFFNPPNSPVIYKATTSGPGLPDNFVLSVFVDDQNIKYFGTGFNGISTFKDNRWQKVNRKDMLASNRVTALYVLPGSSNIWSGGTWGGLSEIVVPPIIPNLSFSSTNICKGSSITLSLNPTGGFGGPYKYLWNNSFGSNWTTQTITDNPQGSTNYYFSIDDDYKPNNSNSIQIYVSQIDTSKIIGPNQICAYSGTAMTYYVSAGTQRTYNWTIKGGIITSADGLPNVDVIWDKNAASGILILKETDLTTSCTVDQKFNVNIDTVIASIRRKGDNLILCTDSGMQYQWFRNESLISGANKQFYNLDRSSGNANGIYQVQITTPNQCQSFSNTINIAPPVLKTFPIPSNDLLNIEFCSEILSTGKVEIKNMSGKLIEIKEFNKQAEFQKIKLDLNRYKPGIYNYSIYLDNKKYASENFIVE